MMMIDGSAEKATFLLSKAQFNIYDSGNKVSKPCSPQALQMLPSPLIPMVYGETDELNTSQIEIGNGSS